MRKRLSIIILIISLLFPIVINAETMREQHANNSYSLYIDDSAELFTAEQMHDIRNSMLPLLDKGNVVLKTKKSGELIDKAQAIASDEYTKLFSTNNGTILFINVYNGETNGIDPLSFNSMYVISFGSNRDLISESQELQIIWENTVLVKEGKYLETAKTGFNKINECFNGGRKTDNSLDTNNIGINGYTSEISSQKVVLEDDADLLTPEEEAKLADLMESLTEYGYVAFKTISTNDTSAEAYASNYYHSKFGTNSGTLFLIDMYNRKVYIFSDGYNHQIITNNKAEIITDNIYRYASNEDYYGCAEEAFTEIKTLLEGGKISEPMRYASNIVLSLVLGFLLTFSFVAYSMGIRRSSNSKKIEKLGNSVAVGGVTAFKTGQKRVYSPPSDSGGSGFSSGGGGGGFSGGGSSGGGGGHSF